MRQITQTQPSQRSPEHVAEVARWTHERLGRVLERHGRSLDELSAR